MEFHFYLGEKNVDGIFSPQKRDYTYFRHSRVSEKIMFKCYFFFLFWKISQLLNVVPNFFWVNSLKNGSFKNEVEYSTSN